MRQQLAETRDDLQKDEEIFAGKNEEIKHLQKLLMDAKNWNEDLVERINELESVGQVWVNKFADEVEENVSDNNIQPQFRAIVPPDEEDDDVMMQSIDGYADQVDLGIPEAIPHSVVEVEAEKEREISKLKNQHEKKVKELEATAQELEISIQMKQRLICVMTKKYVMSLICRIR